MERSSSRLYSGPLSVEAQKILEALQAQRRIATRQNHRYFKHNHLLENLRYGSQWEPLSHSYTSEEKEERKDRLWSRPSMSCLSSSCCNSQWQDTQASAYSQSSQTLDFYLTSQASSCSPCWDSSLQTPQTEAHYLRSHMYSPKNHSAPPASQSSHALSFTQCGISETASCLSQKDRYTLCLQTPQRLSEHLVTAWRNSEEITPHFTIDLSPENPDESFPITADQKDKTEDQIFPAFDIEMISSAASVKDKWPDMETIENIPPRDLENSASFLGPTEKSSYQYGTAKTPKPIRLNLALEEVERGLYLTNQMSVKELDAPDGIPEIEEENQEIYATKPSSKVSVAEIVDVLPHNNNLVTLYGVTPDIRDEDQPVLCEERISLPVESEVYKETCSQSELHVVIKTSEICSTKVTLMQNDSSNLVPFNADADKATTQEGVDEMEVKLEEAKESKEEANMEEGNEAEPDCSDAKRRNKQQEYTENSTDKDVSLGYKELEMSAMKSLQPECGKRVSTFTNPTVEEDTYPQLVKPKAPNESRIYYNNMGTVESTAMTSSTKCSTSQDLISSSEKQNEQCNLLITQSISYKPSLKPPFKRRYEAPQPQSTNNISSKVGSTRRLPKWEPPRSSKKQKGEARRTPDLSKPVHFHKVKNAMNIDLHNSRQTARVKEKCNELLSKVVQHASSSADCAPPKQSKYVPDNGKHVPETPQPAPNHKEHSNQPKPGSLTLGLTSDPRVTDASKINQDEMSYILEKAGESEALVLTMVFRDGTTQLDPEQKLTPPVCGLLLLMKNDLHQSTVQETPGANDSLVYLKLEHTPAWAQQPTHHLQEKFTRNLLLHVFSRSQLVVCYKAKDVLRVVLQLYKEELTWKQVLVCQIQDPQVSGWLLDPADTTSCFQHLLNKHCRNPHTTPALGGKKVSQIIAGLYCLYKLNRELCSKLQSQGLWGLYSDMELKMIPVLAAMESCHIHVDKEALRRTSDLLGTKMKQLEQEAHKAAGQMFLLTSSTQLRTVLFEKLRLHERCENKKLPKTINKQQSTSEAALLQLQDLHPLPKIILEYRQIHKIKSTFVDGILSCIMTKNYISSKWYQTSVVTGRISSKHPNFQALPRQPLQVTRKQYIPGKEEEVVTVHPRTMFIPKDGWTFLSADFCQVELRLLAHLSSDPELLRIFTNPKADIFSMLASQWKGVSETEVTTEDREHAKRIVYSVVYGAGLERLSGILGVSAEQALRFQDSFLQTYKEVQTFIQKTVTECQKKGYVLSIMGRRRTLPNINSPDWGVRMQAERQAVNFVVQGSAADLCKMAMIRIFSHLSTSSSVSARLIAQLHDELLYEVEDSQVEQFAVVVKSTMESLEHINQLDVHLRVPLKVAVSSGKSWGSMSELNVAQSQPSF